MNKEYLENVMRTASGEPFDTLTVSPTEWNLFHAVLGVSTELGELLECLQHAEDINVKVDEVNLNEEIGDLFWYLGLASNVVQKNFIPISIGNHSPNLYQIKHNIEGCTILINTCLDIYKKAFFYRKGIDKDLICACLTSIGVILELMLGNNIFWNIEEIKQKNIDKLRARYSGKFTQSDATERDLEKERAILESKDFKQRQQRKLDVAVRNDA